MTFATLDDRLDDEGVDVGENGEGLEQLRVETATDATEVIAAATTRLEDSQVLVALSQAAGHESSSGFR